MGTDYESTAASSQLAADAAEINSGGVPTWHEWLAEDDTVEFGEYYRRENGRIMMYAAVYIHVAKAMDVEVGLSSDDSIQVLLDGQEILINSVDGPVGSKGRVHDVVPTRRLGSGAHLLMVKVFNFCGSHAFRLRFQDPETGEPLTEEDGIKVCVDPDECGYSRED